MTLILQKFKVIILAILGLCILAAAAWAITAKPETKKIPSRGVFVSRCFYGQT